MITDQSAEVLEYKPFAHIPWYIVIGAQYTDTNLSVRQRSQKSKITIGRQSS